MIGKLKINNEANGLAYFIEGKLKGVEIFNRTDIYQDYFQKILMAVAMDAEIKLKKQFMREPFDLERKSADVQILEAISDYNNHQNLADICDGVCLGQEHRLRTEKDMYYDLSYNEQTIHQSILVCEKDNLDRGREDRFNPHSPANLQDREDSLENTTNIFEEENDSKDNNAQSDSFLRRIANYFNTNKSRR